MTKINPKNIVTFNNVYTPPGFITVTKEWSTGDNVTEWPTDIDYVSVVLWKEAPLEQTENPQFMQLFLEDTDGLGDPDDLDEPVANDNGDNDDEGVPPADDNGDNDDEGDPDTDNNGDNGEITFTSEAQYFFSGPETTPDRTIVDTITLTKVNPIGYFEDFVKEEGYEYYLNEVTVDGYYTQMEGDIYGEKVIFDNSNRAVITITNFGDDPAISITKEVLNSPQTLSGGKATFNYKLEVKNEGNTTLENVTVEDVMNGPSGATLEYSENADTEFVIGEMEPGEIRTIEYSVTVDKAGTYENTATATGLGYSDEEEYSSEDSAAAVANNPTVPPTNPPGGGGSNPSRGTVRVRFVDEDGNVLSAEEQLTGNVGTSYETNARDIEGYTLTAVPSNAEGTFINGVITVTYIYDAERVEIDDDDIPEGVPEEPIVEEETPEGSPDETMIDEELPKALPQTGLPIVTLPDMFGGALIALGLYFGRKAKKDKEKL